MKKTKELTAWEFVTVIVLIRARSRLGVSQEYLLIKL
jgi:hypothetical protein